MDGRPKKRDRRAKPKRDPKDDGLLEALNTLNTVMYHEEGLRRIQAGEDVSDVFEGMDLKGLYRLGIINRRKSRQKKGRIHWVVETILERLN